jgi:hypothetical protein
MKNQRLFRNSDPPDSLEAKARAFLAGLLHQFERALRDAQTLQASIGDVRPETERLLMLTSQPNLPDDFRLTRAEIVDTLRAIGSALHEAAFTVERLADAAGSE